MKYLILSLFILNLFSCKKPNTQLDINTARRELKDALSENKGVSFFVTNNTFSKKKAIDAAESLLFKIYGKDQIINERPYNIYFIDDYWILSGSMPDKYSFGGVFLIVFSSKNGRVIKLTHGK